ncbi:hypothetical protein L1887_10175 [Cichorium endivia]|nr:hypothetical protein L1887_10175 [Cichorium endivia]
MASLLQRLVRKQSCSTTLITSLNTRILSPPSHLLDPKPEQPVAPIPFFNRLPKTTDESNPHPYHSTFYPSFAFESFLNPISQLGFIQHVVPEEDIVSGDDERGIWADSVKKKRKKKMNKHKLKKLRKRLRRKT